ncbi:hypothetical protein MHBO_001644 [Bonamia ostreae]|uniref:TIP41-like protein n=1 Tax=Bonamia ostreae TaxID=126728 RepID=A0ABV2AJN5_9EUKA
MATANSFIHKNWEFKDNKAPISSETTKDQILDKENIASLPEMFFGDNYVQLTHDSNFIIRFDPLDSIVCLKHVPKKEFAKVKYSKNFAASKFDVLDKNFDWTFSSPYKGTFKSMSNNKFVDCASLFVETADIIDIKLLEKRDKILWFSSVILFEDELHDNGISVMLTKTRVMDDFFLSLIKLFVRVDDVLFRVKETRIFHAFNTDYILREFIEKSETFEQLSSRGVSRLKAIRINPEDDEDFRIESRSIQKIKI